MTKITPNTDTFHAVKVNNSSVALQDSIKFMFRKKQ